METSPEDMVQHADAIAERAHEGQTDKGDMPYVDHPRRVAKRLDDPTEKVVALLHDVLEDSKIISEHELRETFGNEVADAVVALTKVEGRPLDEYYEGVRENELARRVKLADIADNLDPDRVKMLDPIEANRLAAKYSTALEALSSSGGHTCVTAERFVTA